MLYNTDTDKLRKHRWISNCTWPVFMQCACEFRIKTSQTTTWPRKWHAVIMLLQDTGWACIHSLHCWITPRLPGLLSLFYSFRISIHLNGVYCQKHVLFTVTSPSLHTDLKCIYNETLLWKVFTQNGWLLLWLVSFRLSVMKWYGDWKKINTNSLSK